MDMNYYKQYEPIFGAWKITRLIGEGSFGKVFEIEREDFGVTYKAALKAITVPASEAELRDVMADGMDEEGARQYYSSFVQELVREFALMSRLKGNSNIVSYENHTVIEHKDGIGWDILIQMELLTPLNEYTRTHTITRQDIIKLGIDMCKALELCQKYNVIHRDIKPDNMFVSENGDFKLGDFGIARTVEKTTSGLSKKGTYTYMAPEVYKGEAYGSTVDIYSLGVVLYRLLNENRTPFLPAYPAPITHSDRENALAKRFSGAPMPFPVHGDGRLGEIVLRACAYEPGKRYSVPLRMREDLEAILYNREESRYIYPEGDEAPQKSIQYIATGDAPPVSQLDATQKDMDGEVLLDKTVSEFDAVPEDKTQSDFGPVKTGQIPVSRSKPEKQKSGTKKGIIAAIAAVVILASGAGGWMAYCNAQQEKAAQEIQNAQDEAYALYQSSQFSQCAAYIESAYAENESVMTDPMQAILASACFELGDYERAADIYQLLSMDADYEMKVENLRDYAVCLARLGRLDEAATVFVMLTDQGASADVTEYVLGETYYAKGDYENAAECFRTVLDTTEDETLMWRCYNSLAETYRESGDYQASIELLEEALDMPQLATNPVLYEMLGMAYYECFQKNMDAADEKSAAQAFEQAINLGIQKEYMYENAAQCYFYTMQTDKAMALVDEMQAVWPNSYRPHYLRAMFLMQIENGEPANQRDFTEFVAEYEAAKSKATSSDDQVGIQVLESYMTVLKEQGWL